MRINIRKGTRKIFFFFSFSFKYINPSWAFISITLKGYLLELGNTYGWSWPWKVMSVVLFFSLRLKILAYSCIKTLPTLIPFLFLLLLWASSPPISILQAISTQVIEVVQEIKQLLNFPQRERIFFSLHFVITNGGENPTRFSCWNYVGSMKIHGLSVTLKKQIIYQSYKN